MDTRCTILNNWTLCLEMDSGYILKMKEEKRAVEWFIRHKIIEEFNTDKP